ncbi:hypothetical protein [Microbacterium sp. No. 7]|uniref:hypothetical protein n=1 Tax=Microbacterium sp. No. 7 TaxID=1714373 RepID=UPI0006ED0258|nr:hypothetical protein [Microbacterium sp. No. 7]ALJ18685.1 hypothetical protein AOA12_01645 [Microbacterium sp. No. 7]
MILTAALSACTAQVPVSPHDTSNSAAQGPEFSGPWAAEFSQAYTDAPSDFIRSILAQGEITDANLAETQQLNKACLESAGFSDVEHFMRGGLSVTPPKGRSDADIHDLVRQCSDDSGLTQIETLYTALLINPDNADMDELAVQCLITEQVVEPSFTVADLQSWYDRDDPRLLASGVAANCTFDPLKRTGEW